MSDDNPNWDSCVVIPIKNLKLTKAIKREIQVGRVHFVDKDKLPYVRKRFGFPVRISQYPDKAKEYILEREDIKTLALIRHEGKISEIRKESLNNITESINILAFSRMMFAKRDHIRDFGIDSDFPTGLQIQGIFNTEKADWKGKVKRKDQQIFTELNFNWKRYHRNGYFFDLLKVVNGLTDIKNNWKNSIIRVAELGGKSFQSMDLTHAFLENMIALEILLTTQDDNQKKALRDRLYALLGLPEEWEEEIPLSNYLGSADPLKDKITRLYDIRCDLVHEGESDRLEPEDLMAADALVYNVLGSVIKNIDRISSKGDFMRFFKRVKYEDFLNEKGFRDLSDIYSEYDRFWHENEYKEKDIDRI